MDLATGDVVPVNESVAMSGMDLLKIPIVLETYRTLGGLPSLTQRQLISDTLVVQPEHTSANALLGVISGEDDLYAGAEIVTESMQSLGLQNTYIATPFDETLRPGQATPQTPANSVEEPRTRPDVKMQTTAEDMGLLLSMIYYCAQGKGGTLSAVFGPTAIAQTECQELLSTMRQNKIGSLIEAGVPPETVLAHRHGWTSDTHADAAIVSSEGGDYVIVTYLYKPDWLEWELSSPLLADISRAAYNFFNFDQPFLGESTTS
jgi:hypothetical protein